MRQYRVIKTDEGFRIRQTQLSTRLCFDLSLGFYALTEPTSQRWVFATNSTPFMYRNSAEFWARKGNAGMNLDI